MTWHDRICEWDLSECLDVATLYKHILNFFLLCCRYLDLCQNARWPWSKAEEICVEAHEIVLASTMAFLYEDKSQGKTIQNTCNVRSCWLRTSGNGIMHADLFHLAKSRHSGLTRKYDTIRTENNLAGSPVGLYEGNIVLHAKLFMRHSEGWYDCKLVCFIDVLLPWILTSNFQTFAWVISSIRTFEWWQNLCSPNFFYAESYQLDQT